MFVVLAVIALALCLPGVSLAEMEPIVIYGSALPAAKNHSTRIIDSDEAKEQGIQDLSGLLKTQPSLSVREIGGQGSYSDLSIRGSTSDQVSVYLDGVLLNAASGGAVDLSQFPLDSIERVEIHKNRGPIDSKSAGGGIINIVSKRHSHGNNLSIHGGSFDSYKLHYGTSASSERLLFNLMFDHQQSENDFQLLNDNRTIYNSYDDRIEPRHNNQTSFESLYLQSRYQADSLRSLHSSLRLSDKLNHIPDLDNSIDNSAYFRHRGLIFSNEWDHMTDWDESEVFTTRFTYREQDEVYEDIDDKIGLEGQDNSYRTKNLTFSQTYRRQSLPWPKGFELGANLQLSREDYDSTQRLKSQGFVPDEDSYRRDMLSVAVETPWSGQQDRLAIIPKINLESLQDSDGDEGTNHNDRLASWFINTLYAVNDNLDLSLQLSQVEKVPGFSQRYADHGLTRGNPDLKSETARELAVGISHSTQSRASFLKTAVWSAQGYYRNYRDLIILNFDSRQIGRYENEAESEISGLEFELNLTTANRIELQLTLSLNDSVIHSDESSFDGNRIPNTPTRQASLIMKTPWLGKWRGYYRYRHADGLVYDRANLLPRKTEDIHNIGIHYQAEGWKLKAGINNVTDQVTETFNGYPGRDRYYFVELATQL
jgi:iron complex outermembrane receptor protein